MAHRRSRFARLLFVTMAVVAMWTAAAAAEFYAVIVGVADYPGMANDLKFTDDDALAVCQTLLSLPAWAPERIVLLLDSSATKLAIREAMVDVTAGAGADDVFFFYFSGHGTTGTDLPPLDEADGRDEYLCAYGSALTDFVRDDELETWLADLVPGRMVIALDSCFSGGAAKGVRSFGAGPPPSEGDGFEADLIRVGATAARDVEGLTKCLVALMAADDHEYAYELGHPYNHGLFTYFLLEAMRGAGDLNGDEWTTAEECYEYAVPGVQSVCDLYGLQQHPQLHSACPGGVSFLQENGPIVRFADPGLEAAVREAIGKAAGDIYDADLVGLTELPAADRLIVDLGGIEHCVNLITLDLAGNRILDLAPLSDLANLARLTLSDNLVSDVAALSSLTSLASVLLDHNEIADVAPFTLNSGLGVGDRLDLRWNALDTSPDSPDMQDIQTLVGRGVDVLHEPQRPQCVTLEQIAATSGWYMISLPGALCGSCAWPDGQVCEDLACALGDDVNPFIAYRYDPGLGAYGRMPPADQICYQPGMSVWIYILEDDVRLDANVVPFSVDVEVALGTGWNQVGNPYSFDIGTGSVQVRCGTETLPLLDAQRQGWASAALYGYDTATGAYVEIDPASGCLPAWTGCWIQAYRGDCTIVFQPVRCEASTMQARPLSVVEVRALELPPPPPATPPATPLAVDIPGVLAELSVCNVPNPVRSEHATVFRASGPKSTLVEEMRVDIYDLNGKRVFTQEIAAKELAWHTVNDAGELLASGVYLYQVWVRIGEVWYPMAIRKLAVVR